MAKASPNGQATTRFVRSVNVERDHRDDNALGGYVLTGGGRRVLERITAQNENGSTAWTVTGPYGTGKSAFSVFILQLLAPPRYPGHIHARTVLKVSAPDTFDSLFPLQRYPRGLWPIVVTGSREPMYVALLRGLKASISASKAKGAQGLLTRITKSLSQARSGNSFSDRDFLELISESLDVVCGASEASGLFLLIDELGKLLEYAAAHPSQSDVYVLQHLAEWAAKSPRPVRILTVLHQDFAAYADRLSATERAEWDKVRGRYEDIVFEESADELLRLVANARAGNAGVRAAEEMPKEFLALCRRAAKLQLSPSGMQKGEFLDLLNKSAPLHPLVAVLLGHVFRKLAQNERSAFSFLSSAEPHALTEYLEHTPSDEPYAIHHLYDYLVHALGDGLYMQRNGKRWAEIESILDRLPDATACAVAVLKTVGLLNAVGEWRRIVPSRDIIEFALAGTASSRDVEEALEYLEKQSAIVNRRYNGSFALWQGSDINVDELVSNARSRLDPAQTTAALAQRYVPLRPVVARRHSFETGTLRYLAVQFVHSGPIAAQLPQESEADGTLCIAVPENAEDTERFRRTMYGEGLATREDVLLAVPRDAKAFDSAVRELACLEWVKQNTPALEGDVTARRELWARMSEVQRNLETIVAELLAPVGESEHACHWYYGGGQISIRSRRDLQAHISDMCRRLYPSTPIILNELINRRDLSSAAAAGRRNLIQAMLEHADVDGLAIEGTPPERSMYLSVLVKFGLHRQVDGVWQFTHPSPRADPGMKAAWNAIQTFFDSCETGPKPLSELFILLARRPFGLRSGPIPVLVGAALIAADSDVAVYEDGSFLPQLSISMFERLIKSPKTFTVRRWRLTGVRATVFYQLADMLGKNRNLVSVGKRNVLDVVRPLLKFMGKLEDYVRQTDRLSSIAKNVRDTLLRTREADQLLFVELPKACGCIPFEPDNTRPAGDLATFMTELKRGLAELQRCYDDLVVELGESLANAFAITSPLPKVRKTLAGRAEALRAIASDPVLRNFITRVTDTILDDQNWVESLASLLTEKPAAQWRDADRGKFEVALAKVSRLFGHIEVLAFASNGKEDDSESLRIGVTTKNQPECERVVHVSPAARSEVNRIEELLQNVLQQSSMNGHKDLAIAALARVTQRLLS